MPGALTALFLLSTGDDQYLPAVKAYFDDFPDEVEKIGDHTWNNGYNGIVAGEYYLRTGDKSVLPILQFFVDDAERRQFFGVGWKHWGDEIKPHYMQDLRPGQYRTAMDRLTWWHDLGRLPNGAL